MSPKPVKILHPLDPSRAYGARQVQVENVELHSFHPVGHAVQQNEEHMSFGTIIWQRLQCPWKILQWPVFSRRTCAYIGLALSVMGLIAVIICSVLFTRPTTHFTECTHESANKMVQARERTNHTPRHGHNVMRSSISANDLEHAIARRKSQPIGPVPLNHLAYATSPPTMNMSFIVGKETYDHDILRHHFLSRRLLTKAKRGPPRTITEEKNEILRTDVAKALRNIKNMKRLKKNLEMMYGFTSTTASRPKVPKPSTLEHRSKGIDGSQDMRNGPQMTSALRRKWRDIIITNGNIVSREVLDMRQNRAQSRC
ncbi:hypothetical protein K440DRAFT_643322 [Wilcoxina mikolae CBS 423.85]|nr:hypothetical protein K440DRAFT_643322 [Wilcoxina mikolae CBS 423.85]